MSTKNHEKSLGPGWPAVRSQEDLEALDVHTPAFLLMPPALVRPVWMWLDQIHAPTDVGECYRAVEMLLVCLAEADARGISAALNDLKVTVRRAFAIELRFEQRERSGRPARERRETPPIPMPEADSGQESSRKEVACAML